MVKYTRAFRYRTPDRLVHQAWFRAETSVAVAYTECDAPTNPSPEDRTSTALTCLWCVQDTDEVEQGDA